MSKAKTEVRAEKIKNKAKAISAELLELIFKKKKEESHVARDTTVSEAAGYFI